MVSMTLVLSRKRTARKSGTVMEWVFAEYCLILLATMSQLRYVPSARPIAVQPASATPQKKARPGTPIRRYALISEASVLIAVTIGPSFLPPR